MASSNTIIVGAGIIGLSTAYYLSESPRTQAQNIHLVDSSPELFECASGYAAGFLAADWFSPSVAALGQLSFNLHKELATKHNGRENWGYIPSTGTSYTQSRSSTKTRKRRSTDWIMDDSSRANATIPRVHEPDNEESEPTWLTRYEGDELEILSKGDTTAQVDPRRLCRWLLERCLDRGVKLHRPGRVLNVSRDARDELAGVRVLSIEDGVETDIPCTRLVITAGPWTPKVFSSLFPSAKVAIPISSLAGHSVVLKSPRWSAEASDADNTSSHAVFTSDPSGFSPEFFSRTDGEIWFGGLNSSTLPLPKDVGKAEPDPKAIGKLMIVAKTLLGISEDLEDLEVLRKGLCFRPVSRSGEPIISRVADEQLGGGMKTRPSGEGGVFVSAGHGPWGITQSLGTGKVLSELIDGLKTSCDISDLHL